MTFLDHSVVTNIKLEILLGTSDQKHYTVPHRLLQSELINAKSNMCSKNSLPNARPLKARLLTQLNLTELSCVGEVSIATPTQLNSTSSCQHVHSENNCYLSMNVVTQFVGRDVINKNTTDLAVRCSNGPVELCRYKHPFKCKSWLCQWSKHDDSNKTRN